MYPRQSPTTHTEQLGDEASVYDWARAQVHALNPTAARVWRQCDGATSPEAIAAALRVELGIPEAEAVVDLTLRHLARVHLLERPVDSRGDRPATTRRWLLGHGVAAAMLPVIYSIVAPSPVDAQSPGPGAPTLTSLSPNQGIRGTTVAVTLTGTNFIAGGTTVTVSGTGITVTGVTVSSNTSLTANFAVDLAAAEGPRTVTVTAAGGTSGPQTFTINPPLPGAPTLTGVSPNQGTRGTTVAVILTGTNFVPGATTVNVSGGGVTVNSIVVGSSTSLTANLLLDPAAAAGARTVTVTTAGGTSGAQTFTITLPTPGAPTLTSVSPNQGIRGTTVAVTLTGTNFVAGATTVAVGGSGVTVANVTVGSGTSLTANFVIDPTAADGFRTVMVTTAAGTSGARIFTINLAVPGVPTLTSVTPNQGIRGITVAVTLAGTNFVVGATTIAVGGGGVTVTNVAVSNGTSLTADFVLDPAAVDGPRSVTVTTAAGTSGAQTFTINLPPPPGTPTLATVSPNQGMRGTTVAVTLTGTNFAVGATTVNVAGGGATVTNVIVGSNTSLTASFVLDPAAAEGPRLVTVTTAGGTSGPQAFRINLAAPTLTGVSPNQGIQGTTVVVTLTGTNFVVGATTVTVGGAGVTVANVVVASGTSLTASFVLDPAAAVGARTVTVTTGGGTSGAQTFTINLPPAPTLTSVSPNQGLRASTVAVTLTGTNFVVGATTVGVFGGGVTVTNVTVGSGTSLTANFVLDPAATAGPRIVTVTTAGGTSGAEPFTISLPPPGSQTFGPTGGPVSFTVPAGVVSILIEAVGAKGGGGFPSGDAGDGGRAVARVSVAPGTVLTVRVGGAGQAGAGSASAAGGFNGGGGTTGNGGGGGGGATSVHDGATPLVIAGGGGGSGVGSAGGGGRGGRGGGLIGGDGATVIIGGRPGSGGDQLTGGAGGAAGGSVTATNGTAGMAGTGGTGGSDQPGVLGGGGGGGGYFGGGGGGGGTAGTGGGGGGSSFTAPGATEVLHQQGSTFGNSVIISW